MDETKFGFVYIWFDRKHKRYYIGSHWGTENDGYICSSSWMKKAYKKRPHDFKPRRIIARIYTNRRDLLAEEQRWLQMIKPTEMKLKGTNNKPRYYNLARRAQHWIADEKKSKTTIQKVSNSLKEMYASPRGELVKKRISEANKKYNRKNGGPPNKGIPMSQEQKTLLSKIRKGRKLGPNKNTKAPYTKIEVLQQQGYNEREIAELLGVTTTAVYNTIRRYGGTPTKKTIKAPYDKIKSLWIQGYNKTAIAKICGVTREAIRNSIRRHEAVK